MKLVKLNCWRKLRGEGERDQALYHIVPICGILKRKVFFTKMTSLTIFFFPIRNLLLTWCLRRREYYSFQDLSCLMCLILEKQIQSIRACILNSYCQWTWYFVCECWKARTATNWAFAPPPCLPLGWGSVSVVWARLCLPLWGWARCFRDCCVKTLPR